MTNLRIIDTGWELSERDPRVGPWAEIGDRKWQTRRMEVYAAQIDRMDQGIGRILQALEETGQRDDTLIIFFADNGGCAEELGPRQGGAGRNPFATEQTRDGRALRLNAPSIMRSLPVRSQAFHSTS